MWIQFLSICALQILACGVARGEGIGGTWVSEANGKLGSITFVFNVSGRVLTGTATPASLGPADLGNGKFEDDKISFEVTREALGIKITTKYSGALSGDIIKLRASNFRGTLELVLRKK
ncbi:MAG: hypothetical protein JO307_30525 [Bryobacterales bacterium]|nr:hypothetical protein [Bryobacterales bacterium]MBV9400728.1 hypothetical protein [Bryobacterales bacterium]